MDSGKSTGADGGASNLVPSPLTVAQYLENNLDRIIEVRPAPWREPGWCWMCLVCVAGGPRMSTGGDAARVAVAHLDEMHPGWRKQTSLRDVTTKSPN